MGLVYLPTFTIKNKLNVGMYIPYMDPLGINIVYYTGCFRDTFSCIGIFAQMWPIVEKRQILLGCPRPPFGDVEFLWSIQWVQSRWSNPVL